MTIYDGRESFYQWDLNQKVTSDDFQIGDKIHFYSMRHSTALVTKAYLLDNKVVADVPNILLQTTNPIRVYRFISTPDSAQTVDEQTFIVKQKQQPADYFYTETELYEMRKDVENAVEAEGERQSAELLRQENETNRIRAESERVIAESNRVITEAQRIEAESGRAKAETNRVTAEQHRSDSESNRQTAEQERQSAETLRQTTFEQTYNNVANALKGSASGEVIRVDDVSPIEHLVKAKVTGENIDPTTVTVTRCGKNEFDAERWFRELNSNNGGILKETLNGVEYYKFKPGNVSTYPFMENEFEENTSYTFSFLGVYTNETYPKATGFLLKYTDETSEFCIIDGATEKRYSITTNPNKTLKCIRLYYAYNEYAYVRKLQIECNSTATEHEAYKGETYTPSADGTVDIASVSPTMTLLTNTAGVTIEAEYNRDINVVINDILKLINKETEG